MATVLFSRLNYDLIHTIEHVKCARHAMIKAMPENKFERIFVRGLKFFKKIDFESIS